MKQIKYLIFGIMLSFLIGNLNAYCYQETANQSTIGNGICGLNYTGTYLYGNGDYSFYVNYTKPIGASNLSLWRVKHGNSFGAYNINIPLDCWNLYSNKLSFKILGENWGGGGSSLSQPYCFNGTDWVTIGTPDSIGQGGGSGIVCGSCTNQMYDGNWSSQCSNLNINCWNSNSTSIGASFVWEEAMNWIVSSYFIENNQSYSPTTMSGNLENFNINLSIDPTYTISSAKLVYNGTAYTSDSINNYGSGNYIISKQLVIPKISSPTNVTFYWNLSLTNSTGNFYFNSSYHNQTINSFAIDNCASYTTLLLNYTLLDELTQNIIPDSLGTATNIALNIYSSDYSTLIANISLGSTTNNTKVCMQNSLSSSNYYMDVITSYSGGSGYQTKYNNIQKYPLNSSAVPINVPLYDLNSSLSTEFKVTFKDANFQRTGNVLVDVTRKYLPEGTFKSVEVAKTDSNGETLIHLQLSNVIYTIIFIQNGQILGTLDSVLAKCQNPILATCEINFNPYITTTPIQDFNYVNGIAVNQNYDISSKVITANLISQSGTASVTLNVTKFDRFGNTTVCSDFQISSAGTLQCIIPDSFGNFTVQSNIYSNGVLVDSQEYYLNPSFNQDDTGSVIILAMIIIITMSMMFISDVKGILIGCFLGMMLSGALMFVNSGNLFSKGTAITWAFVAIIIILWKINRKEES